MIGEKWYNPNTGETARVVERPGPEWLFIPYPFCHQPEKCAGTHRCQAEWCCND